uniref:Putative replication-associated protein n=1 Tax=Cressdnaviricota sp. TaxID=2748378 RepID=A0A6M3YPA2_9VIRU|nr:MAG: putative replication-associated protein [Cressdnaviricota sp.]
MSFNFFILTIPLNTEWTPPLTATENIPWIKGQQERGAGGYLHWQVVCRFANKVRLLQAKRSFPPQTHVEASRSAAANAYVWKDETAVEGTRFEVGVLRERGQQKLDWDLLLKQAIAGDFAAMDPGARIRYNNSLRSIHAQEADPGYRQTVRAKVRQCSVVRMFIDLFIEIHRCISAVPGPANPTEPTWRRKHWAPPTTSRARRSGGTGTRDK